MCYRRVCFSNLEQELWLMGSRHRSFLTPATHRNHQETCWEYRLHCTDQGSVAPSAA